MSHLYWWLVLFYTNHLDWTRLTRSLMHIKVQTTLTSFNNKKKTPQTFLKILKKKTNLKNIEFATLYPTYGYFMLDWGYN